MATRSQSAPILTKLSPYETSPKFSIRAKRKERERPNEVPAANKYDTRELVKTTSKYGILTRSCSFGAAPRFPRTGRSVLTLGPGQYNTTSTLGKLSVGFGSSDRPPINGYDKKNPGPGTYVSGNTRYGETSLSHITCSVGPRVGWFYDNREAGLKPGPGTYHPIHSQIELLPQTVGVGTSNRPSIATHLGVDVKNVIGPGQYPIASTLCGNLQTPASPAYSFTQSSDRTKLKKLREDPPMVLQVTQFV